MAKTYTLFLGFILYFILIALSIVFFKERTVMFDTSFQLFQILRNNDFAIQVNRFGSAITQAFPLYASRLNLSLENIAIIYSMGYNVFYFASFLIVLLVFKNAKMAWVNLLFTIGITTHTFYWIQCELVQGVIFTIIYLAYIEYVLQQQKINYWFYILSPLFLITIVFFHPLLPFVLLFGIAFLFLQYRVQFKLLFVVIIAFVVLYFIKSIFLKTDYDSSAMGGLNNFKWLFPNYFTIQANKNFIHYCLHDYYFIPLIFSVVVAFYFYKKSFLKLILFGSFFFGYLLIVNVSHQGGGDQFYLESQYLMLMIFLSMPLLYDVLPNISSPIITRSFLIVILLVGVIRIYNTHFQYTKRLNWYQNTIAQTNMLPNKKVVLKQAHVPMNKIILSWGSAYEFWLLSTIEQHKSMSIIIAEKEAEFDDFVNNNSVFIGKWERINYSEFNNKNCFIFNDNSFYSTY
ncbi:MAG: hypothetical protein RJA07_891 [Bacteroidota bacterium]|jgi:hypothetical protein